MYLPTFWKLTAEAWAHKSYKLAGWGLPAGAMGKSPFLAMPRMLAALGRAAQKPGDVGLREWTKHGHLGRGDGGVVVANLCRALCSGVDWFPLLLQLDFLHHHPSQARSREERHAVSSETHVATQSGATPVRSCARVPPTWKIA